MSKGWKMKRGSERRIDDALNKLSDPLPFQIQPHSARDRDV